MLDLALLADIESSEMTMNYFVLHIVVLVIYVLIVAKIDLLLALNY